MSLKQLYTDLKLNGWHMNKFRFYAKLDHDKQRFWPLTKITGPKGSGVTMRSALNTDPTTISGVPNTTFRSSFDLEQGELSQLHSFCLKVGHGVEQYTRPILRYR